MLMEARLMSRLLELVLKEDGQDLVEYGLLAAFIALAVITSIDGVRAALGTTYQSLADDVDAFTP
jgi:Flp pilus assembly pilin Flp